MITIFAEKPDVGTKIAAALDGIQLDSGKKVSFDELGHYEKQVKAVRSKNGYIKINYLGEPSVVTWGYGHMCELKQAKDYNEDYKDWRKLPLPYIPDQYELKLAEGMDKQFAVVKKCFENSRLIICATDNDREGDLIFDYIYRYMGCHVPYKRAVFNKQSEDEYKKAFSRDALVSGKKRLPVIEAGRARSAGDFIAGAGTTVAMTLKYSGKDVLSVGRVQIATLNMIVQRENEIRNFKPKDYYIVKGLFQKPGDALSYVGTHVSKKFDKKEDADALMKKLLATDKIGTVVKYKTKEFKRGKPYLYSLDTLQMDANKAYGFSLDHTLELAQSLYEKGYTTYPRTDAVHLTDDMVPEMTEVLNGLFSNPQYAALHIPFQLSSSDRHYFDSSKVESHYAIVPTTKPSVGLSGEEERLYRLIAMVTICMVYPDAILSKTELDTDVQGEVFHTSGTSIVSPGFYQVLGTPREKLLPVLSEGDQVTSKFAIDAKKTEPPKRYTAASLLNAMLNCGKTIEDEELKKLMADGPGGKPRGLGRPSSRASIVATLGKRKYITEKGKTIYPTERGMSMMKCFPVEDMKSAAMTAQWEKRLDDIEKGTDTYDAFMNDLEDAVRKWTMEILNSSGTVTGMSEDTFPCPLCSKPLREFDWGYSCPDRQSGQCDFALSKKIAGKTLPKKQIEKLITAGRTDMIQGFYSKSGREFSAALVFNKADKKIEFDFEPTATGDGFICPLCGSALRSVAWGYSCSSYKETGCKFSIGTVAHKKLTDSQIKNLLCGKKVHVKGMVSKKGAKFEATVYLGQTGENKGKILFDMNKGE